MYKGPRSAALFMNFLTGSRLGASIHAAGAPVFAPLDARRYEFAYRVFKMR